MEKELHVTIPTEINAYYCPECDRIYERDYPAYIQLDRIDDEYGEGEWSYKYTKDNAAKSGECGICANDNIIPIYTMEAQKMVESMRKFGFDIINVNDRIHIFLNGSINVEIHDPLEIEISVPDLINKDIDITYSDKNLHMVNMRDRVYCTIRKSNVSATDIYDIIYAAITNNDIYVWKNICKLYANAIGWAYGCHAETICDNGAVSKIVIENPSCINDIFASDIPNGISVNVSNNKVEICINRTSGFDLVATDKWLCDLKQRVVGSTVDK